MDTSRQYTWSLAMCICVKINRKNPFPTAWHQIYHPLITPFVFGLAFLPARPVAYLPLLDAGTSSSSELDISLSDSFSFDVINDLELGIG